MPKLINQAKIIILALALALGISYVSAAGTWAPPTAVPPGGMVDVPLNVGSNAQIKAGDLGVGAFLANLNSQFLGNVTIGTTTSPAQLRLVNGTQGAGKVLVSDSSGLVSWAATSSLGISSSGGTSTTTQTIINTSFTNFQVFNSSGTYTVPAGITKLKVEVWGAGGGSYCCGATLSDGISGAGGGYAMNVLSVTPGTAYSVVVGSGGGVRAAGGQSYFGNTTLLRATGGTAPSNNVRGLGGSGSGSGTPLTLTGGDGNMAGTVGNIGAAGANGGVGGTPGNIGIAGCGDGEAPGGGAGQGGQKSPTECSGGNGRVIVWW